jgi:hypothetical protein
MKLQGRIYELSKEAGFTGKYDFPYGENLNPAIQKFAELIVEDSIGILVDHLEAMDKEQKTPSFIGMAMTISRIRENFGVE